MPRVLLNFGHREFWSVHFIEADCRTLIGSKTRGSIASPLMMGYVHLSFAATLEDLAKF
jgi:hypothetical protein